MGVVRMHHTTNIVSAGVDWLTVTASEGKQHDLLREYGVELLMEDAKKGNKVYPFRLVGFEGGGSKNVQVGERGPSVILRLMGAIADSEWPEALALAQGCSRIDLQVSVRQEPFDSDLAIRTWQEAKHLSDAEGKPPRYDLYARKNAGSTLYIGDRSSRWFARMYDRWAKTKDDDDMGVWRYEIEAKQERAVQVAGMLQQASRPDYFAAAVVYDHFSRRGVVPIFSAEDSLHPPPLRREATDADGSLKFLRRVARPVLERLESWGRLDDAYGALGLAGSGIDVQGDVLDDTRHS
jgi:replication initiation factor